jgi:hypothetical protein
MNNPDYPHKEIPNVRIEQLDADPRVQKMINLYRPFWSNYMKLLRFMNFCGKKYSPTARLIMFSLIEFTEESPCISTDEIVNHTGACLYAVRANLVFLTKEGIVVARRLGPGSRSEIKYRLNLATIIAKTDAVMNRNKDDYFKQEQQKEDELDKFILSELDAVKEF